MTEEELKNKCKERAKIFQQAMESCHSSSPIDCIEWFADRIAELEAQIEQNKIDLAISEHDREHNDYELTEVYTKVEQLEKENAELEAENQKWKNEWQEQVQKAADEGYARTLQTIQLTKAKEIIKIAIEGIKHWGIVGGTERPFEKQAELEFNLFLEKAEQFLKYSEVEK